MLVLPVNIESETYVSSTTLAAGETYYLTFPSQGGGALTQIDIAVEARGAALTSLDWAIMDYDANGGPGTVLASGSLTTVTAAAWNSISISGVNLDARKTYLLRLTPVGDTVTIRAHGAGYTPSYYVHTFRNVVYRLYQWSGTAWTFVASRYYCIIYAVGGTWYGNPFTTSDNSPSSSLNEAGNSYVLSSPVTLIGAFVAFSAGTGSHTVRLYECGADFLPTNLLETVSKPPTVSRVIFSQTYTLSRFTITIQGAGSIGGGHDAYSADASRVNAACPEIRAVQCDGTSWQIATTVSGKQLVCAWRAIMPIVDITGGGGGGGGQKIIPAPILGGF